MKLIALMELRRLFVTPAGWLLMAIVQVLLAYLFLRHIDYFAQIQGQISAIPGAPGVTQLIVTPFLNHVALVMLLITPFLTMRTFAEERRQQSFPLLLSAPVSFTQIVLGKFLGTLAYLMMLLALLTLMPISLSIGSQIDWYQLSAGLLGLILLASCFVAIGLYLSALTDQPVLAAGSSFCVLFLLWIMDWTQSSTSGEVNLFSWLSLFSHYEAMLSGEIFTADIAYFLIISISFLVLTIRHLEHARVSR